MVKQKGAVKTGGRKVGSLNKTTSTVKEWLSSVIDSNREQIEQDLQMLEPKERMNVIIKHIDYVCPKSTTVENKESSETYNLIQQTINKCNEEQ